MHATCDSILFFPAMLGLPGGSEWIILLVLGLLIFGRRLPEVGRSLGRSIVEFKKGVKNIEDEVETESSRVDTSTSHLETSEVDGEVSQAPDKGKIYSSGGGENATAVDEDDDS